MIVESNYIVVILFSEAFLTNFVLMDSHTLYELIYFERVPTKNCLKYKSSVLHG